MFRSGVCAARLSGRDRHAAHGGRGAQFILDRNPAKRRELIDQLLARDEYADYLAMKWGDLLRIKAEFPINLWPNAAQAYHHWIRDAIRTNRPCDQFARDLLTASGSNFEMPPVNFYRAMQNRTPAGIAQTVALTCWANARIAGRRMTWPTWRSFSRTWATSTPANGRRK